MLRILENGADLVVYLLIQDRNFFHYMPWAGVMNQKLRLLAFLDHGITKVCRFDENGMALNRASTCGYPLTKSLTVHVSRR